MKKIFFTIMLTATIFNTHAQFAAVLSKNGFVRLKNDSIILSVPAELRGDIQWQSTNDSITWEEEESNLGNALAFKPIETKSYRLVIKEGSCDSLFSDTCKVFAAHTTIPEYISFGISVLDLFNAGIMVGTLEQNGVQKQDLVDAGLVGNISDVEGNDYKWVRIGTQIWMAENLKTSKLNNGDSIPLIENGSEWENASSPAYCWYDNLPENASIYGALYNWFTVTSGNLCPAGWHVPNNNDWQELITCLGGEDITGGKLKQQGTEYWHEPNEGGSNESGFKALPGGWRFGSFFNLSEQATFWSSTPGLDEMANSFYLTNDRTDIFGEDMSGPASGRSVRCIKD